MEGVETVDVSWLHHSQKDNLFRTKSASSVVTDKTNVNAETVPVHSSSEKREHSNGNPPLQNPSNSIESPSGSDQSSKSRHELKARKSNEKIGESKTSSLPPGPQNDTPKASAPRQIPGRRNSWIQSLSSKFSSGSTPPSQSNAKESPANSKTIPAATKLDFHNPFGAAYSPKDKEEKKDDPSNPFNSSSPKSPSFLTNALRRFSSGTNGFGKMATNGIVCQRRVMNVDRNRDRCKIPDLNQAKLRRVAFCVDVEIAGVSRRESDDEGPVSSNAQRSASESRDQKSKKSETKSKDKSEGAALKNPQAVVSDKEKNGTTKETKNDEVNDAGKEYQQGSVSQTESKPTSQTNQAKEPTRKQEKKRRSEEERKERKERRRRQAEANGSIPLQLTFDDDDNLTTYPPNSHSKTQSHPTIDPVRIYRRCCQLRETPVLKKLVDQISSPSSTLAESPGTVAVLDLTDFPMTLQDIATFSDWLAVVPVRKLILENCALTDEGVRAILAGLLSTKTVEQARYSRRRRKANLSTEPKEEKFGVVEKLSLKNNPQIGPEGWRHICLFVHLSRSLKAIDLSGIPFPKMPIATNGTGSIGQLQKPVADIATLFSNALSQRFGGNRLEELLLSECKPTTETVGKICDAAIAFGLRRLGLANNDLTREGFEHVIRYFQAGQCEGLDLGGNDLEDHLDLLASAINSNHPLYALSLADCSLTPPAIYPLLQAFTRLPNFRFVDFSHNRDLFSMQPDALAMLRRFLPKMPWLKRIHLADVNLSPDHAIALAEILPECQSLCHLNILENDRISRLSSATDPASQEEACAVYASLMAAVRVSRTIIAVDIEVPSMDNNEVVKALASQIVAYSLRNLERRAVEEEIPGPLDSSVSRPPVPIPEILQHIVGHIDGEEPCEEEDEPAPDEDYVIGGTGVVKALGVCLGNAGKDMLGDLSAPPSGTSTPRRRKSRPVVSKKRPRDMSKNLLESARNIRTRIQSALVREDRAGNDTNYRRLQFLDFTLQRMIQRFEDEFPETRIVPPPAPAVPEESSSQHSADSIHEQPIFGENPPGNNIDTETAIDDEDTDNYIIGLSRSSSNTSLYSRALTSEEGRVLRLGQNLRRDFLNPSLDPSTDELSGSPFDDSHMAILREKLERLRGEEIRSRIESVGPDKALEELGSTVEELYMIQKQDAEAFQKFKQSQIAAQINGGLRAASDATNCDGAGKSIPDESAVEKP
ncbi:hypothetical protein VTN00DRAFT_9072 [Thermoascus crustaceus]|uniref:uncharacterized protein n=1 Tax=Thermoascus crustaceus TaxID=5088 RepID=UPI0037420696